MKKSKVKTPVKAKAATAKGVAKAKVTETKLTKSTESDLVRHLAGVLNDTGLSEIEYESGGMRIRVARHAAGAVSAPVYAAPAYAPPAAAAPAAAAVAKPADPASHPGTVKSPMVGMFYLAPEPGAAPFIAVGDAVKEGQTLALIEAMKTFNPVKAPRAGKVVKILLESGSPVEYGEPLVIIE